MVIKLTDRGFAPDAIVLSFVADDVDRQISGYMRKNFSDEVLVC
jgi:hypothetical protein